MPEPQFRMTSAASFMERALVCALFVLQVVYQSAALSVSTCEQLAAAMANSSVASIVIPESLTVGACMPDWGPGHVQLGWPLTISAGAGSAAVKLVVEDQRFLDYFVVIASLTLAQLYIVAPAAPTQTTTKRFVPVIFAPQQGGVVIFEGCVVTLTRPDASAFSTALDRPLATSAALVGPSQAVNGTRALGAGRLLNGFYEVDNGGVACSDVTPLLANRASFFATAVNEASVVAGWQFLGSFVAPVTAYSGGLLVSTPQAFSDALNSSTVAQIYVQNGLDVGAVFETQALNASTSRYFVTRDLLIYGEYGAQLDFRWSAEVVRVQHATLTISGGLVLQRMSRPTLGSLPYNCFLGAFVFESNSTLRLRNVTVEHVPSEDLELWALAGSTDPAYALPQYDNATWSATNYVQHLQYNSRRIYSAIQQYLPPASRPVIAVSGGGLAIRSWAVDEATWDLAVLGKLNGNDFFGSYDLQNVSLVPPAFSPDECDGTTGVEVTDSVGFRNALNDSSVYRIKLTKSFAFVPTDWPTPDNQALGINITRRVRVVGCESEVAYTVVDTANLFRVIYVPLYGSFQFYRVRFTNIFLAPRRLSLELLVGIFSAADNGTLDFEGCAFEGAAPGAFFNDLFVSAATNQLVPNQSYAVTLRDHSTGQTSRLVPQWALVTGPFVALTQGNLTLAATQRSSWNYVNAVVSTPVPSGGSGGLSDSELALVIALPIAGALLLTCCLLAAFLLWRRRRGRRDEQSAAKARYSAGHSKPQGTPKSGSSHRNSRSTATSRATRAIAASPAPQTHWPGERGDEVSDLQSVALEGRIGAALTSLGRQAFSPNAWDQIKLGKCIGTGGFGKVYKGYWRGSVVAVKVINLPAQLTRAEKLKRMAVMETAISSSLSHPNIIPTYAYAVRSIHAVPPFPGDPDASRQDSQALPSQLSQFDSKSSGSAASTAPAPHSSPSPSQLSHSISDPAALGGALEEPPSALPSEAPPSALGFEAAESLAASPFQRPSVASDRFALESTTSSDVETLLAAACEVRLVQEFAPWGTLRNGIDRGRLCVDGDPQGLLDFAAVLDTAMDVCKALVHLHTESVVHCDLKPSNVLLVPSSASRKRFVAKVADFGMAQSVPTAVTHVSNVWQGTMTHMAPEVLVSGKVTYASDVYALGIVMWEMVTRQPVRFACPAPLVPFMVSARGMRPVVPDFVPERVAELVRSCWAGDHLRRPTALQVYNTLSELADLHARGELGPCRLQAPGSDALNAVNTAATDDVVSADFADANPANELQPGGPPTGGLAAERDAATAAGTGAE